jgi:acyl-CoA reductase-like NAD-dependent aldehyde dehydrogenase
MNVHSVEKKQKLTVIAPATGKVISEINETPLHEVPIFYQRGKNAFKVWSSLTINERMTYFKKLKELMVNEMDEIARIISEDTGKVLTEAIVADIMPILDSFDHIIKHAQSVLSRQKAKTPLLLIGKKSFIEYMPRGVVLVISPWNYPLQLAMIPMLSALAGGNTVILKPSEVTPLVGKCIEDLFQRSGFPEGTVQVAHGGKEVGAAFTAGKPDYIFFTGSVRTGKIIQQQAARDLIPTTLELGGKDPMIVFGDANLVRAAKAAVWGAFTNSGQVCMSAERLYVERPIFDQFLELLIKEVNALTQGNDEDADVGSMTFPGQKDVVKVQLEEALERGAKLQTGMDPKQWREGMYLPLTVVTEVKQDMKIIQEETFGPLLPVVPFNHEEEAISYANGTAYGLNASIWTKDKDKARRVASKLVSGAVVINDVLITVANHGLPFGGTKESGIGRYHAEGGLRIFCHEKAIMEDMGFMNSEIQWYPYKGKYPLFLRLFKSYFSEKRNWVTFTKSYLALLKRN